MRRGLLQFDIDGLIPDGVTITDVSLELNVDNVSAGADADDYSLSKITTDWGEGTSSGGGTGADAIAPDATWTDAMFGTDTWTTAGGDFTGTPSATISLPAATGTYTFSTAEMVTDVQEWLDDPATNFGWILTGNEADDCTARRFGSKDVATAPVLTITYECAAGVTAICQPLTVYLDEAGLAEILAEDLDGGSIVCEGSPTFEASITSFSCEDIFDGHVPPSLIISGVFDADLPGGEPKGVELFVVNDIEDLSIYGLGSANNGGGTDGEEFTFPAESATAGSYIYVASEAENFESWFGFAPNYTAGAMAINGDDAVELFMMGEVSDVFGEIDVDGTDEVWEYEDGWAYRVSNTGPDGAFFDLDNWVFSGVGAFDGATTNDEADPSMPIGTFTTIPSIGVPVTLTVTDEAGGIGECATAVTVIDTLAPTVACVGEFELLLDETGNGTLTAEDLDAGTTDGCGIDFTSISMTSFSCFSEDETEVMFYAQDIYGNIDSCMVVVTVNRSEVITVSDVLLTNPSCNGLADGSIGITVSGGTPDYTYDWDNDGTGDADDMEDLSDLGAGTYEVIVADMAGCSTTVSYTLEEADAISATALLTGQSCINVADGEIDITVSGGEPGYTYEWDKEDAPGFDAETEDISDLTAGDYFVTITDAAGCVVTEEFGIALLNEVDVTVIEDAVSLTSNEEDAEYQWLVCPGFIPIDGETNQIYFPEESGGYAVSVTSTDGCTDTSECVIFEFSNVEDFENSQLSIYPNPTNGNVTVQTANIEPNATLNIVDMNGRMVYTTALINKLQVINLSTLENGVYFVRIQSNNAYITKKLTLAK